MDTQRLLEFVLILGLHFQGIGGNSIFVYNRLGEDAILPCGRTSHYGPRCSSTIWLHNTNPSTSITVVWNGNVRRSLPRADNINVTSGCSLLIHSVTTEDVGFYTCRQGRQVSLDVLLYLSVLTISPSPPDPKRDGEVTLQCSLFKYSPINICQQNSIRWVDETGAALLGDGDMNSLPGQETCSSVLTVKRQRGPSSRYTCQFVDTSIKVATEAHYTPDFTDPLHQTYILIAAVVGGLVALVVIAAVLVTYKKRVNVTEDVQTLTQQPDEPECNLTYITVSYANQQPSPQIKVKEQVTTEDVTYSTLNIGEDRSGR